MHRKSINWIVWITMTLTLAFLGSFTIVMNQLTEKQYKELILPAFNETVKDLSTQQGMELFKTLGAWFGVTMIGVLILAVLGTFFMTKRKYILPAAICFFVSGIVLLIGSQLVAFVLAFPFFVAGALAFYDYSLIKKENIELERKKNGTDTNT